MKAEIFAPFAGIITRQEYRLGETVSISDASISLIDDKALDIEVNIPEADIAEVKIGQDATVDLDAYGPDISFNAKVVAIDPGETIVDGVATYKATLHFLTQDERIRSGMTANVNILTNKHEGVLRVPSRMITNEDGKSYIYIGRDASKALKTEIQIVLRGSDGAVEVSSLPGSAGAIKEGDSVTLVN
jgi:HlyD family secretion protein